MDRYATGAPAGHRGVFRRRRDQWSCSPGATGISGSWTHRTVRSVLFPGARRSHCVHDLRRRGRACAVVARKDGVRLVDRATGQAAPLLSPSRRRVGGRSRATTDGWLTGGADRPAARLVGPEWAANTRAARAARTSTVRSRLVRRGARVASASTDGIGRVWRGRRTGGSPGSPPRELHRVARRSGRSAPTASTSSLPGRMGSLACTRTGPAHPVRPRRSRRLGGRRPPSAEGREPDRDREPGRVDQDLGRRCSSRS